MATRKPRWLNELQTLSTLSDSHINLKDQNDKHQKLKISGSLSTTYPSDMLPLLRTFLHIKLINT